MSQGMFFGEMKKLVKSFLPEAEMTHFGGDLLSNVNLKSMSNNKWNSFRDAMEKSTEKALGLIGVNMGGGHFIVLVKVHENDCWVKNWGKYQKEKCDLLGQNSYQALLVDFPEAKERFSAFKTFETDINVA